MNVELDRLCPLDGGEGFGEVDRPMGMVTQPDHLSGLNI